MMWVQIEATYHCIFWIEIFHFATLDDSLSRFVPPPLLTHIFTLTHCLNWMSESTSWMWMAAFLVLIQILWKERKFCAYARILNKLTCTKQRKYKKNLKKKQTNKTKAFSVYPDIFIIQKHRYNYLFCATKSEKVLLKISTKYMLYFLKIKKKETHAVI